MRRLALLTAAMVAMSGCASPSQIYVANKTVGAFFAVPDGWYEVPTKALDRAEFDQIDSVAAQERYDLVTWQIAYTPLRMKAADVLATNAQDFPVAFLRVRNLSPAERAAVSLNTLRDLVFPVTPTTSSLPVTVNADQEVSQPGGSGVDLTFEVVLNERTQKLRQIAILSQDRQTVYLFVLRCSKTCFNDNSETISQIAKTFTVRGSRG